MLYEIGVCVDTPYIVNDIADDCGYTTGTERKECGAEEARAGGSYLKQFATSRLAGLYELFSRANTRLARNQNYLEGKELMENNGMSPSGSCYYNAD